MNADDVLNSCQAYLDGHLDAATAAAIDRALAENPELAEHFAQERAFHAFIKAQAAQVAVPAQLVAGIQSRLAAAGARPGPIPIRRSGNAGWFRIAAGVMLAVGALSYALWPRGPGEECPYMVACADAVASGKRPVQLETEDCAQLAAYVAAHAQLSLSTVPPLEDKRWHACAAGMIALEKLKAAGAPDAAFLVYRSGGPGEHDEATLLIHPWANKTPLPMNLREDSGVKFWVARHGQTSLAAWQSTDSKELLTLVSSRPKEELYRIAQEARRAFIAAENKPAALRGEASSAVALK